MNKKLLSIFSMLLTVSTTWAQVYESTDNETPEEDEITVIDREGREEVIEFPEAMTM